MHRYLFLLFSICFSTLTAQESSFSARITNGEAPLEGAHILNLSEQVQTISDSNGSFTIRASVSDTIVISFLGYHDLSFRVSEEELQAEGLVLVMTESGIPLDEITLEQNRALDPVALGLITKRPPKRTPSERKLEEAGDFKAVQLLNIIGGGVPIIPMLNKITGRTKRLKKRVAVEQENTLKDYLQYHYSDYINRKLGLQEEWIDRFLYYAVINHKWDDIYPGGNKEQYQFRLLQVYEKYNQSLEQQPLPAHETEGPSEGG